MNGIEAKRARYKTPNPDEPGKEMRLCLGGCEKMFLSEWIGNRVCPYCDRKNANKGYVRKPFDTAAQELPYDYGL